MKLSMLKWNNQDGPTYTVAKNDVFMIKYKNGEKDVFSQNTSTNQPSGTDLKSQDIIKQLSRNNVDLIERNYLFNKGKRYKSWGYWYLGSTMIAAIVGGTMVERNLEIYCLGATVLSVGPAAALIGYGNHLENKARKIDAAYVPISKFQLGDIALEPNLTILSNQIDKSFGVGLGTIVSF